ncbi:MAG: 50S ribosomal protein L15 [Actinobacteria bacterium]|nr:50S ribosomal protein L15 [Actinomycetota bacterium]
MTEKLTLHTIKPAQDRKGRKRVGRGQSSGKGRYSGRGIKGQKSRSGSHKMRAGFEGGQMPIYMRLGKQRGATSKDAMPIGPFRTSTAPVNVSALDRFDDGAEVTPESLVEKGLLKNTKTDVKLLGNGELKKKLTVRVHAISATAREKVEQAGGTVALLKEPKVKKKQHHKPKPKSEPVAAEPESESAAPEAEASEAETPPESPVETAEQPEPGEE